MSDRSKIAAASKNIVFVPLNRLKKSPKNVRKVPHTKANIQAFAASIAALGMLQYPVVEPELGPRGKPTAAATSALTTLKPPCAWSVASSAPRTNRSPSPSRRIRAHAS
ncbi:MAG: hypothetical protein WB760_22320 [Xanthobacteraceae bacterium]